MEYSIDDVEQLAGIAFGSEDDLIARIILPFFEILGWKSNQIELKYSFPCYRTDRRGRKPEADCVFFSTSNHDLSSSLLVVEAKRDDQPPPVEQARFYASNLFTPFYITWESLDFQVFQLHAFKPPAQLGEFSLKSLTNVELSCLATTISPKAVLEYVKTAEVKTFELDGELKHAEAQYVSALADVLGEFKLLDLARTLDIRKNYVPIYISSIDDRHNFANHDESHYGDCAHPSRLEQSIERQNTPKFLADVVARTPHIAVVGDPGSGKTTLLKHLCLENSDSSTMRLPVFVSVRESVARSESLVESVKRQIALGGLSKEKAECLFLNASNEGRMLLCVDGLDELDISAPSDARQALRKLAAELRELSSRNRNNLIVISARRESWPACRSEIPPSFVEYEVLPLRSTSIQEFIQRWFLASDSAADAEDFIKHFSDEGWPEIASNPLLLALLCVLYEKRGSLPSNEASTISRCIEVLLEEWDAMRRISRRQLIPGFNPECKCRVLSEIALRLHERRRAAFLRSDVIDILKEVLPMVGISENLAGDAFDEITSQHGLIRSWSMADLWAFPHLCFQEWFAAYALRDRPTGYQQLLDLRDDPFWRQTLIMYSTMGDSTPLVDGLLKNTDNILFSRVFLAAECMVSGTKLSDINLRSTVVRSLVALSQSSVAFLQEKAIKAIAALQFEEARLALKEMVRDSKGRLKPNHLAVRYVIDLEGTDCIEEVVSMYVSSEREHDLLLESLRSLPSKDAISQLEYIVTYHGYPTDDPDIGPDPCRHRKRHAIALMGIVGQDAALKPLQSLLRLESLTEFVREATVRAIASIPGEQAKEILSELVLDPELSAYCRISAAHALGPEDVSGRHYLKRVVGDPDIDSSLRRDAARVLSEFVPNADEVKALTSLLLDTRSSYFLGGPAYAGNGLVRSGESPARQTVLAAVSMWKQSSHEQRQLVVESLERALRITDPDADHSEHLFGAKDSSAQAQHVIWQEFPEILDELLVSDPEAVLQGSIRILQNCPEIDFAYPQLAGVLSALTRLKLDAATVNALLEAAKRCSRCEEMWDTAESIWKSNTYDESIRKLFY